MHLGSSEIFDFSSLNKLELGDKQHNIFMVLIYFGYYFDEIFIYIFTLADIIFLLNTITQKHSVCCEIINCYTLFWFLRIFIINKITHFRLIR